MRTILVTGAGGNAAQSFIESLRLGEEVRIVGVDVAPYHLQCADVDARYIVPKCSDPSYLDELRTIIENENVDLVHAQPDVEVEFISEHRDEIPATTFLPPHEAVLLCHDKLKTSKRLASYDIPHPRSYLVERVEDIPWILRQFHTEKAWCRAIRGAGSRAALPVSTKRQAEEWIHYWRANRELESKDFMLCEFLPGREYAFQSLWYEGELVTSMARERMEYMFGNIMPSGQSSSPSVAKTVHDDMVNETAVRAILASGGAPHGIYCVDLKENGGGIPCVTEINIGRFFTTSNFFSHAGCNMPYIYTGLALGEARDGAKQYNAVPKDLYWIRGVDRKPQMFTEETWKKKEAIETE